MIEQLDMLFHSFDMRNQIQKSFVFRCFKAPGNIINESHFNSRNA